MPESCGIKPPVGWRNAFNKPVIISEFGGDARVIFQAGQEDLSEVAAADLLPGAFNFGG